MREAVIVAYGRTPCCRARKGGLADMHPVDYAAQALKGVLAKVPQVTPDMIGDVITGCAMPVNELNLNTSRLIVNRAQLPDEVPAQTINRFCSSGLQAIATAANAIIAGEYDCAVAGGVECMTKCFFPYDVAAYGNKWIEENYPGGYMTMGETAERVADHYNISRVDMEKMAGMKPCFRENGKVTAATSSQTTDAAAYVVVMEESKAKELGIKPIAKFVGFAVAGCDATEMGMGPLYAIPKLMKKLDMTPDQMDVIELNEAFASQALACIRELGLNMDKVNPYGGAMALGHPMGATGAFLTCKALDYLRDNNGKYALVTMCIGGGMGAAGVFELL